MSDVLADEVQALAVRFDNADWDDVRRRAAPTRNSPRRKRIALAVVSAVVAVVAVGGPTVAFSGTVQRLLGLSDHPGPVLSQARFILEAPAGDGVVARTYTSPFSEGGQCEFQAFAPAGSPVLPAERNGGGSCTTGPSTRSRSSESISFFVNVGRPAAARLRPDSAARPLAMLGGVVPASLHVTRVELQWATGAAPFVFKEGHFLLVFRRLVNPSESDLPVFIVAYDAQGMEVAREKVPSSQLYVGE